MAKETIVAGIDVGTSSVKCVIGSVAEDGVIDIIGTGTHRTNGLRNGIVYNRTETVSGIREAVDEAELMAGCDIKQVSIAIAGQHMRSFNSNGLARIRNGQVSEEDIANVIDTAQAVLIPPDSNILHTIPQEYIIDGQRGIQKPIGMSGVRLEVRAHLVTGAAQSAAELGECCRENNLEVTDFVFAPLAAAEAILRPEDRELGVVIVDIGGGATDIAVFQSKALIYSNSIAVGGDHITSDIRDCLHTPTDGADLLKREHGCAMASLVANHEEIEVPGTGGRKPRSIKRSLLCEIIEARVAEIFTMVSEALEQTGYEDGLPGGVVLTGGTTNMLGIIELAEEVLAMPVSRGEPQAVSGLVDVVKNPRFATGTGLTVCAAHHSAQRWFSPCFEATRNRMWSRFWRSVTRSS